MKKFFIGLALIFILIEGKAFAQNQIPTEIQRAKYLETHFSDYERDLYTAIHYYRLKRFDKVSKALNQYKKDADAAEDKGGLIEPHCDAIFYYINYRMWMYKAGLENEEGKKVSYLECKDHARDCLNKVQTVSDKSDAKMDAFGAPGQRGVVMEMVLSLKQYFDCYDRGSGDCGEPVDRMISLSNKIDK